MCNILIVPHIRDLVAFSDFKAGFDLLDLLRTCQHHGAEQAWSWRSAQLCLPRCQVWWSEDVQKGDAQAHVHDGRASQGMELGLRAMVAAGAQSVMTLHSSRFVEFRSARDAAGQLLNTAEFEAFLAGVHAEGVPSCTHPKRRT